MHYHDVKCPCFGYIDICELKVGKHHFVALDQINQVISDCRGSVMMILYYIIIYYIMCITQIQPFIL